MKRRAVIRKVPIPSMVIFSGCLNLLRGEEAGGNVLLRNEDRQEHSIRITITDGSEVVFEIDDRVDPTSTENFPDAFGGGAYDVTAELDGATSESHHLTVGDCSAITLHVIITPSGDLEIEQGFCD